MIKRFCDKCGAECLDHWYQVSIQERKSNDRLENWADAFVCAQCVKQYMDPLGVINWAIELKPTEA